jgi:hypothetical protein
MAKPQDDGPRSRLELTQGLSFEVSAPMVLRCIRSRRVTLPEPSFLRGELGRVGRDRFGLGLGLGCLFVDHEPGVTSKRIGRMVPSASTVWPGGIEITLKVAGAAGLAGSLFE